MAAEDQESDGDQEAPQYGKPEVELEDELAVGDEDAEALGRDDRRHGREYGDGGKGHHIAGDR